MELKELFLRIFSLAKAEPIIALIIAGIIAILFYFKTKEMMKVVAVALVLVTLFYFFTLIRGMTSTGLSQKEHLIQESQQGQ
jgi:branched-subunit amino acid transport protein